MTQESALGKAVAKLGETDRLLVEASTLSDDLKERITNKIGVTERWGILSTAVYSGLIVGIALMVLAQMARTTGNYSAKVTRDDWLTTGMLTIIFLIFDIVALMVSLHFRGERAILRQLLIHGSKPDKEVDGS